eukprot:g27767.t1
MKQKQKKWGSFSFSKRCTWKTGENVWFFRPQIPDESLKQSPDAANRRNLGQPTKQNFFQRRMEGVRRSMSRSPLVALLLSCFVCLWKVDGAAPPLPK